MSKSAIIEKNDLIDIKMYNEIKILIEDSRKKIYNYVNSTMVMTYWAIGKIIVEYQGGNETAKYGDETLQQLSKMLTEEYGKGFTLTNLKYMRQFYITFQNRHALSDQLSWTHYRFLMKIHKKEIRDFYMKKLEPNPAAKDIIKDPFVLEFLDLKENKKYLEKELEQKVIDNLQEFLLELGKGFCFVGRQKRIDIEEEHYYIDLVFYNYILKCFVLIDLKIGRLTHQDIGQMDFYVRYYEDQLKQEGDNPTIGIILCSEKSDAIVKYSVLDDNKNLFASKYMLYLPSEEELKTVIANSTK